MIRGQTGTQKKVGELIREGETRILAYKHIVRSSKRRENKWEKEIEKRGKTNLRNQRDRKEIVGKLQKKESR